MSLCSIMGICDSVPGDNRRAQQQQPPTPRRRTTAIFDMMTSPSVDRPVTAVKAPDSFIQRLGEKTAAQVAALDDWVPKANPHMRMAKASFSDLETAESARMDRPIAVESSQRNHSLSGMAGSEEDGFKEDKTESSTQPDLIFLKHDVKEDVSLSKGPSELNTFLDDWVPKNNPHTRRPKALFSNKDISRSSKMIRSAVSNGGQWSMDNNTLTADSSNGSIAHESSTTAPLNATAADPDLVFDEKFVMQENEFQVNDHNMDTDSHTWRPMKIDNNGDLKPVVSELLSNKTLKIISDTWFPNSKSLKERD